MVGLGFTGYWFDTYGYDAPTLASIRAGLAKKLRVEPLVSRDKRFLFYDLRPYAQRLERGHTPRALRDQAGEDFGI
jgi:hypothetical protein